MRILLMCLTILVSSTISHPAFAKIFDPTVFTLKNGLTVIVVENHRAPIVHHMVWYKVGAADEDKGKSGLAHLLEHLMFKGTDKIADGEYSKIIAAHGGQDNAMTGHDFTGYYQRIAVKHLPMVMEMEADRMQNLRITEKQFQSEREVVREERLQRVENEPGAMLSERLNMGLWMNHPYAHPIGGFDEEIRGLTRQDALDFYKKWYAPNNAVLYVAGDVTPERVKSLAEKYYGKIPPAQTPKRTRGEVDAPAANLTVALTAPTVRQAMWYRTNIVPSCATSDRKTTAAYSVLSEILGGGTSSRLYKDLVLDKKSVLGIDASYNGTRLGPGTFSISASPKPGQETTPIQNAIKDNIAEIAKQGVTESELKQVRDRMLAAEIFARDDLFGAPQALAHAVTVGCSIDDVEKSSDDVQALTSNDIQNAAKTLMTPYAIGYLYPTGQEQ